MRLILVRHGETTCNLADIWHGWDDCSLTERGEAQAEAAAQRLAGELVAAVYCSDSRRAVQTARTIAAPHGLQPIPQAGLRERHAGVFEGLPVTQVVAHYPDVWENRAADYWGWRPPEGESFHEVLSRGLAVVHGLQGQHAGDTVALVSHMGMVRALISALAGISLAASYDLPFPSTGISILKLTGTSTEVEVLNDAAHLRD